MSNKDEMPKVSKEISTASGINGRYVLDNKGFSITYNNSSSLENNMISGLELCAKAINAMLGALKDLDKAKKIGLHETYVDMVQLSIMQHNMTEEEYKEKLQKSHDKTIAKIQQTLERLTRDPRRN